MSRSIRNVVISNFAQNRGCENQEMKNAERGNSRRLGSTFELIESFAPFQFLESEANLKPAPTNAHAISASAAMALGAAMTLGTAPFSAEAFAAETRAAKAWSAAVSVMSAVSAVNVVDRSGENRQVLLQVVDVRLNQLQSAANMGGVAVNVSAVKRVPVMMLGLFDQSLNVVEKRVKFRDISLKVERGAFVVNDRVNVAC